MVKLIFILYILFILTVKRGCKVLEPGNNVVSAETEPCVSSGDYNTSTQLCCGTLGKEKILSKKQEENICCGDAQYSNGTHECLGDPPSVKERPVSPGTRSDRASIPRPAGPSPSHSASEQHLSSSQFFFFCPIKWLLWTFISWVVIEPSNNMVINTVYNSGRLIIASKTVR